MRSILSDVSRLNQIANGMNKGGGMTRLPEGAQAALAQTFPSRGRYRRPRGERGRHTSRTGRSGRPSGTS
eukprot:scaffold45566_cov34-Prasinocladus_malaysianus.AAC.3